MTTGDYWRPNPTCKVRSRGAAGPRSSFAHAKFSISTVALCSRAVAGSEHLPVWGRCDTRSLSATESTATATSGYADHGFASDISNTRRMRSCVGGCEMRTC